jgi:hypothetical protein
MYCFKIEIIYNGCDNLLRNTMSDLMTIEKSTVKININKERGSATIYLKKGLVENLKFESGKDLLAEYDTEKNELHIKEW